MDKISVLMIGNDASVKGGITSVIKQLLKHDWNKEGIQMNFIPTYINANIFMKMAFFLKAYIKIKSLMKKNNPDIVHIHMSYKGSFFRTKIIYKLCKKNNIPIIIHLHGSEFEKWYNESNLSTKGKIKEVLSGADTFIVLGNKWKDAVKRIESKTNTIVVSNAISIPECKARWNSPFQVLFLGVLIRRKGIADLLNAIKKIKEEKEIDDIRFVIAGSGEEKENLLLKCKELEIEENISFIGWVDGEKKRELIKESQLLVLPSYNEGLPISILEAISYGLPVVATDVGDISSAVKNGENGFLIQPGDIDALAKNLIKIIDDEKAFYKMSQASRNIAIAEFSDEKYYEKFKECYYSLKKVAR